MKRQAATSRPLTDAEEEAAYASLKPRDHCRACAADRADIGTFDHGVPHTLDASCAVPRWAVDACRRVGNHVFHVRQDGAR